MWYTGEVDAFGLKLLVLAVVLPLCLRGLYGVLNGGGRRRPPTSAVSEDTPTDPSASNAPSPTAPTAGFGSWIAVALVIVIAFVLLVFLAYVVNNPLNDL